MADDNRFRSNLPHGQGWPSKPASGAGDTASHNKANDPLAELARLIGQTDPFGEVKQGAPRAQTAAPRQAAPQSRQPAPNDPYGSPLHFSGFNAPKMATAQSAYDHAAFGATEPHETDHASEGYYEEPAHQHGDEHYDDYEDRPRRRWLKLAVAAVALVVIGGGGVYGYRTLFNGVLSGPPPVIKANTAPSKMAAPAAADNANKQIYDRVGEASAQGERVVSREERPVEVKDASRPAPRVVFPNVQTSSASQDPPTFAPLKTDPGGPDPSAAEPKRIRTVAIRPDGTGSTSAPAPAQRSAAAAPVQAAPAPANAPISLSPQAATAEASTSRPAFPPMPGRPVAAQPTRLAAVPPATEVAAGSYTVQISSQRSENEAQASFRSLQTKYPTLLGDRQPIIRRADLGEKGIYFRTMVGPFASIDEASKFCGSLKSAGAQCVVQRN